MNKPIPPRAPVNSSAQHVFEVLRLVSEAETPLGVAEIARRLSLPASTVYRALITLEESEYITRFQHSPRYELGPLPRLLCRALFQRFELQRAATAGLRRIARDTGETTSLCVRVGWYALRVAVVYGGNDFYHRDRMGEVAFLHDSLPARAILAFLDAENIAAYWRFAERRAKPPAAERKAAEQALANAQRDSFLTEPLALSPGYSALAMPIRDPSGRAIASIMVSGPVQRSGAGLATQTCKAVCKELETAIAAEPARFASPFAHLDPDEIFIRLPPAPPTVP